MNMMMQAIVYPCEKVAAFAYDYLEGTLPPLTRIRFHLHLNGCEKCREFVRLYRAAANPREFLAENPIPDSLLEHTLEFLEKELGK
jgi:predicted anti-sigma-YlaC factor YlaD